MCCIRRFLWLMLVLIALLTMPMSGMAETASDMTDRCTFTASDKTRLARITDGKYRTPYEGLPGKENWIEVTMPAHQPAGGVQLYWTTGSSAVLLEQWDSSANEYGPAVLIHQDDFLHEFVPLAQAERFRLRSTDRDGSLSLVEMSVYSTGDLPESIQRWEPRCTDADLLVFVAHPDDEYIFMGGMIPYYAAERGLHVAVCYMTNGNNDDRVHELLNGLWTAGCHEYPWLINAKDYYTNNTRAAYNMWDGRDATLDIVADMLNTVSPTVVVTHDINGEYGHGGHRAVADAALSIIRDGERKLTAPVQKLYLHLWKENMITMDWQQPLTAFNGKTALEIADLAFKCHKSQQNESAEMPNGARFYFKVKVAGPYDNARFGLAWSNVGPDENNDLMDHLTN